MDNEKVLKKKKLYKENQNVAMRKIRIIYSDPDATDSSSDDEDYEYGKRVKRVVREVYIPMYNSSEGSLSSLRVEGTQTIKEVCRREDGNSTKDTIPLQMDKLVPKDEVPNEELEDLPILSPLPNQSSKFPHECIPPLRGYVDDPVLNGDELFQYPPLRKQGQVYDLGKEELDWLNSL